MIMSYLISVRSLDESYIYIRPHLDLLERYYGNTRLGKQICSLNSLIEMQFSPK